MIDVVFRLYEGAQTTQPYRVRVDLYGKFISTVTKSVSHVPAPHSVVMVDYVDPETSEEKQFYGRVIEIAYDYRDDTRNVYIDVVGEGTRDVL